MEFRPDSKYRFLKLKSSLSGIDWFLAKAGGEVELSNNREGGDFRDHLIRITAWPSADGLLTRAVRPLILIYSLIFHS